MPHPSLGARAIARLLATCVSTAAVLALALGGTPASAAPTAAPVDTVSVRGGGLLGGDPHSGLAVDLSSRGGAARGFIVVSLGGGAPSPLVVTCSDTPILTPIKPNGARVACNFAGDARSSAPSGSYVFTFQKNAAGQDILNVAWDGITIKTATVTPGAVVVRS